VTDAVSRIVQLDAGGVESHVAELAQLLLDAHAAGTALGLAPSLTNAAAEAAWHEVAAMLEPGQRISVGCLRR
jgi:hypothetical protein